MVAFFNLIKPYFPYLLATNHKYVFLNSNQTIKKNLDHKIKETTVVIRTLHDSNTFERIHQIQQEIARSFYIQIYLLPFLGDFSDIFYVNLLCSVIYWLP